MNRETMQKLRLDRRMIHRRDWISPADLEQALAELPDVSDKAAEIDTSSDGATSGAGESAPA